MLKKLVFVIVFLSSFFGFGQDEYGISHSNYAPTKTFLHNPTNTLDNKVWLDIHLIGAGTFIYNDYMYMKGTQFAFGKNIIGGQEWPDYFYDKGTDKKAGFQDSDIQIISASTQYKTHGFAFSSRVRTYFDFRRITPEVATIISQGTNNFAQYFDQVLSAKKMFMNQTSYSEFAFSYSNMFYHFAHKSMALGLTAKYLIGYTGAGIRIDDVEYNFQNPIDADFFTFNGGIAYGTGPGGNEGNRAGSGFAFDLGFVYKKTLHNVTHYEPYSEASACEPYDYKYKLSAAIIDFGYINFNKAANIYDIESDLSSTSLTGNEITFDGFGDFANNSFSNVTKKNNFKMLTPAALNLQADYNYENYYFISAQLMHGFFRRNALGVKRPDVFAVSGRYQRKWFEGSAIVSLYNYENIRLGTAMRFGYLTIGTDKLLSMFGVWDFYGTDVYFNIRYFLSRRPGCKRKSKKGRLNETDCVKE